MSPPTNCLGGGGGGGGGYDLLERKIMDEKIKNSSSNYVLSPPSPPSRHEKWKLAKTKPGGHMTYAQSQEIASWIVSYC